MPITLPPELEARLTAEAARAGVTPEQLVGEAVRQRLEEGEALERERAAKRAKAIAFLRELREDGDEADQRDVGEHLLKHLDDVRRENGERLLFPPEKKGKTW